MKNLIYFIISFVSFSVIAQIKSEEITIFNHQIELPGTLTYQKEKTPLLIWVHGSGNVDRNGNQPGTPVKANYIKQFRDAVNSENMAFFSYDKRTANAKNSPFLKGYKITDFVTDVKKVVAHFKKENRFSKIILVGHSQGSLIAMLALENVDKYISLAGAGETIDKTIVKQITKNNSTLGEAAQTQFDSLKIKGKIDIVNPFLRNIFSKPNQPFLISWMKLDPKVEIAKINIPILIIQGEKDIQVTKEDASKLLEANTKGELATIANMNHVLKEITKDEDNLTSYYSDKFPISEKLIAVVNQFVKK
ncbi:alpha/beta hydrolase [uncultured Polaribacter sp.]|uniref:alpha/beta hydrolase n=1 Tax=uncultured Polaribacter sp. TaxID=174711 RepID=UPI002613E40C|nr:alpha/beta hydrolase [uncultured Polaribacter sp.]